MHRITKPLERLTILRPALGGLAFGLIGVALPLTLFTGSVELSTVVEDGAVLGDGLLIAVILGKILAFAVSMSTGFIGGPLFPALFIGGSAGIVVNILIPEIPQGFAFATMLAAMSAAILPAPFTMVLLAALLTGVGAQSRPWSGPAAGGGTPARDARARSPHRSRRGDDAPGIGRAGVESLCRPWPLGAIVEFQPGPSGPIPPPLYLTRPALLRPSSVGSDMTRECARTPRRGRFSRMNAPRADRPDG